MELNGLSIGYQNVVAETLEFSLQSAQDVFPDAAAMVIGMDQQMGIVDHQKFIGDRFAQANQLISVSGLFAEDHPFAA